MPETRWRGWFGPLAVTLLAAILRLVNLGQPRAVVFDETYYAKDALSLLLFGYERKSVEGANDKILGSHGDPQSLLSIFETDASFVVHPPLGKWIIASGIEVFGMNPAGWRIAVAILGVISVLLVARIARRITRSNLIGTLAGLFMAIDGMGIVMARTALLDGILMFFVLAAFGFLVLDRDQTRSRLAGLYESGGSANWGAYGPWLGIRYWRIAAGVSLGLACGVKWSGLYFVVAFGLLTVLWDVGARKTANINKPWLGMIVRDAAPAFISIVAVAAVAYLFTWWGWFANQGGYLRDWEDPDPGVLGFIPQELRALIQYHSSALTFHTGLNSGHSYEANPWVWPLQGRPTSFSVINDASCGVEQCRAHVLALGNPFIWWAATAALVHQAWRWISKRDWKSGAVLCGFLAGWLPWIFFQGRTIFEFYSIVFLPFMVMALAMSIGVVIGKESDSAERKRWGIVIAGAFVLAVVVVSWFFYPIWVGDSIPVSDWNMRMWFPNWI